MAKFERLLLPVDFERPTLGVVHQAAALARHFYSEIVLLHVVTPLSYSAGMLEGGYVPTSRNDLLDELIRQAQKHLDQALTPELEGLPVKRLLKRGDPALEIVKTAHDEKADLIVMPTHGYGAFRRFLIGSVTAKVLHDSECPVWTGAHMEEPVKGEFALRNILCAIDLSEHSRNTVSRAAELAAEFKAQLTIAHVTADLEVYSAPGPHILSSWQRELASSAARDIASLQEELGTKADIVVQSGDVPREVAAAAGQKRADLLIIGRNPSAGRLRGTGYAIIRESRIPVLSV